MVDCVTEARFKSERPQAAKKALTGILTTVHTAAINCRKDASYSYISAGQSSQQKPRNARLSIETCGWRQAKNSQVENFYEPVCQIRQ